MKKGPIIETDNPMFDLELRYPHEHYLDGENNYILEYRGEISVIFMLVLAGVRIKHLGRIYSLAKMYPYGIYCIDERDGHQEGVDDYIMTFVFK